MERVDVQEVSRSRGARWAVPCPALSSLPHCWDLVVGVACKAAFSQKSLETKGAEPPDSVAVLGVWKVALGSFPNTGQDLE